MSISITIDSTDRSNLIKWDSLSVEQNITNLVDKALFSYRKYGSRSYVPQVGQEVIIYDGSSKIFAGTIQNINEYVESGGGGVVYDIECVDWTYEFDSEMVAESYENMTIKEIIEDIVDNYAPSFTYNNVSSDFLIEKIVFNQVYPSRCLKRLADILGNYDYYIDEDKDIHFFFKEDNTAPYNLQDDSGNYVYKSLSRKIDGSQIANFVKVRGGEADGDTFTDVITVKGNDTKSFNLPKKFNNLTIELDTGGGYVNQTIGIEGEDSFSTVDILYSYDDKTFRFNSALADNDKIRFSGNPRIKIIAVAGDSASIAEFGKKHKLIRDNTIEDKDTARRRAIGELNVYANEIENSKFKTYTSGLRAGMNIKLTSTIRNADTDLIIKKLKARPRDINSFVYEVELVSTRKYELTELLKSLLEPDPLQAEDNEVAERIELDAQTVTIEELIEVINAQEIDEDVKIIEDITKDPLGAGVEPEWVLAEYIPSPYPTDPKRVGLLDNSLKLY